VLLRASSRLRRKASSAARCGASPAASPRAGRHSSDEKCASSILSSGIVRCSQSRGQEQIAPNRAGTGTVVLCVQPATQPGTHLGPCKRKYFGKKNALGYVKSAHLSLKKNLAHQQLTFQLVVENSFSGKPCSQLVSQLCRRPFQCGATQRRDASSSARLLSKVRPKVRPLLLLHCQISLRRFMPSVKTTLAEFRLLFCGPPRRQR
jgi:hypothetical protein